MFLRMSKKPPSNAHDKHMRPFGGPPQSGAVGLPSGARQGITGAYSLVGRTAFRNVPRIGAVQFGGSPMGAQRLTMSK